MFEKLVVSTAQRRKHATAKFFVATAGLYVFSLSFAFVVSLVVSDPKLADTGSVITHVARLPFATGGSPAKGPESTRPPQEEVRPDLNNVMNFDQLMSHRDANPPVIPNIAGGVAGPGSLSLEGPPGVGSIGLTEGDRTAEPPPRPDPPKPEAQASAVDNKPLRVTSIVLQGKAIERRTPPYPPLAKQAGLQDSVAVEVVISPEGRVESSRAISGHPMFRRCAEEAARGWRFGPTLLNNVPVRVTGVITFVFKLSD